MKKLLFILFLLIAFPLYAQTPNEMWARSVVIMGGGVSAPPSCGGTNTYFGNTDLGGILHSNPAAAFWKSNKNVTFTSPASPATQTICEISIRARTAGGTPGNVRMAVYSADSATLICQGSAEVSVNSTTAWWAHVYPNLTGTCQLEASTDYVLAVSGDSTDVQLGYDSVTSGDYQSSNVDYTDTGFPTPLPGGTNSSTSIHIRVGVQ